MVVKTAREPSRALPWKDQVMTAHHPVPFALPIVLALVLAPSLPVAAVESGWYDSVDGTYRVRVPELLTGPIEISAECPNPGITCQVMFTQTSGWYGRHHVNTNPSGLPQR